MALRHSRLPHSEFGNWLRLIHSRRWAERAALLILAVALLLAGGCASAYLTPGRPADLTAFNNPQVREAAAVRPALHFPANLVLVRVQASGYRSESAEAYGLGAYSVMTARDIETDQDVETLLRLPEVEGVAGLNRLLLPSSFTSDVQLRTAAAKLHADALIIYTIDTTFSDRDVIAPLTVLSLGLAPNRHYRIRSSASALLMDVKTGYVYGALEEGQSRTGIATAWGSHDAIDAARMKAEREALDKLLASLGPLWNQVRSRYGGDDARGEVSARN